jgi:hypothetical protein
MIVNMREIEGGEEGGGVMTDIVMKIVILIMKERGGDVEEEVETDTVEIMILRMTAIERQA